MITGRHIDRICVFITVCAVLMTVLFMNGEAFGIEKIVDEDAEGYTGTEYFTANDLDADWDDSGATQITLNGTDAIITGGGAYTYDGNVVIANAGYYVVTGTLTDGSLIVDAYNSSKVWIKLNGVSITCQDDAGIRVDQADKVFLTLAEGSENAVTSGASYSDTALADNTGGAVFSHDDLTINGSGSLTVTASLKHGFDVNDSLVLAGGEIAVTAPADGLHANDAIHITNTHLTINAGDDAIHCDVEVVIADGDLLINRCTEGIEAVQITVEDGNITIYASDDGFNANGGTAVTGMPGGMGGFPGATDNAQAQSDDTAANMEPFLLINGGNITIINETGRDADGLDSNGDITINGGTVLVSLTDGGTNSAIDYASETGASCVVNGGTVIACGSYGMAEHFSETSAQPAILYNFTSGAAAGEMLTLKDTDGNVLLTWEVPCSFSSANISCPKIQTGESYTIVVGDREETITVEEASASYGDTQSMGFGGKRHTGGGMRQRGSVGAGNADASGTPPEMPEGAKNATAPPEMPAGMGNMETPPEMPEGMGNTGTPPGMLQTTNATGTTNAANAGIRLSELTTDAKAEIAVSALVLAAGIAAAGLYTRRRG